MLTLEEAKEMIFEKYPTVVLELKKCMASRTDEDDGWVFEKVPGVPWITIHDDGEIFLRTSPTRFVGDLPQSQLTTNSSAQPRLKATI